MSKRSQVCAGHIRQAKAAQAALGGRVAIVMTIGPKGGQITVESGSYGATEAECKAGRMLLDAAHAAVMGALEAAAAAKTPTR